MKMIRRIVGIAHVADLESIEDADVRSQCEKRSLLFARTLVLASFNDDVQQQGLGSIREVVENLARKVFAATPAEQWPADGAK